MIRLPYQAGYLLISQPAHAWLAGQLAQHWHERPEPYEAVVIGTTLHDAAWAEKDGFPNLNTENEPLNFFGPELDDVESIYENSVNYVMQVDPYAGLLANRHVQTIYHSRLIHGRDPAERLQPLLDYWQAQYEIVKTRLGKHPLYAAYLDDARLDHNYRILRTCDLLSLFVCGAFPTANISDVPLELGKPAVAVDCTLVDEHTLRVSPNLFDQTEIICYLEARYIPQKQFESAEQYREVFEQATFVTLRKAIISE